MKDKLKVLDLFSGIGGFSLGLERTGGFETVAFCEIEEFPRKVLAKHWPEVPCYEDVTKLTGNILERDGISIDVITGGFPCQAFSTAAHGMNNAPDLWPEMRRIIDEVRPKYIIAENVSQRAVRRTGEWLGSVGFGHHEVCISANDCGADHQRNRWWCIAYPDESRELSRSINAEAPKLREICEGVWIAENYSRAVRVLNGVPSGLDAVGSLGNAVIPQIPEMIGHAILDSMA